jgi:hypothetical protein
MHLWWDFCFMIRPWQRSLTFLFCLCMTSSISNVMPST